MGNSICKKFSAENRIQDIETALAEIDVQVTAAGSSMTEDQVAMVESAITELEISKTREWIHGEYCSTIKTIAQAMPMTTARAFVQSIAEAIGE